MSADNWTTCPACNAKHRASIDADRKRVDDLYGTVPVREFDEARAAMEARAKVSLAETFREDYEFYGAHEGVLSIRYSGHCSKCGLAHKVSQDSPFYPAPAMTQ